LTDIIDPLYLRYLRMKLVRYVVISHWRVALPGDAKRLEQEGVVELWANFSTTKRCVLFVLPPLALGGVGHWHNARVGHLSTHPSDDDTPTWALP
jgi:hypothetical protein